jgi:hypothetical protein
VVYKIQLTDAASRQGLHCVTAHTADAEDSNPRLLQPGHAVRAQQKFCSDKLFCHNAS